MIVEAATFSEAKPWVIADSGLLSYAIILDRVVDV